MLLHFLFLFSASLLLCRWVYSFLSFLYFWLLVFRLFLLSARRRRLNIFQQLLSGPCFSHWKIILFTYVRGVRESIVSNARPRLVISLLFFLPSFFTSSRDLIHRAESIKVDGELALLLRFLQHDISWLHVQFTLYFLFCFFFFRCSFPLRVLGGLTTCAVFSLSCTIFSSLTVTCSRDWSFISFTVCCFSWRARGIFTGKQADFSAPRLFVCL